MPGYLNFMGRDLGMLQEASFRSVWCILTCAWQGACNFLEILGVVDSNRLSMFINNPLYNPKSPPALHNPYIAPLCNPHIIPTQPHEACEKASLWLGCSAVLGENECHVRDFLVCFLEHAAGRTQTHKINVFPVKLSREGLYNRHNRTLP